MHAIEANCSRVPALGLGTWQMTGAACREAVRHALALGYRHLDTAQMYDNEADVGAGLAAAGVPREEVFLTTKVWFDRLRPEDLKAAARESLQRLGCDYVDLLLIHWPNPDVPLADSLAAMAELRAEGRTRYIGVSNFPTALMREAVEEHRAELLCNQVEYHPYLSQRPVLDFARRHDMVLTAYCPLAQGRVADDPVLAGIARKHGKTPAQVALRWLLQQERVAAIPKAARPEHMRDNLEALDIRLDEADLAAIDGLSKDRRLIDPAWAPRWDPP